MMSTSSAHIKKHLTDISEWRKLGEAGIFPPDSRVELINGEIIEMSPIGSNHAGHINRLSQVFASLIPGQAMFSAQNPLQLSNFSEPEPDLMLLLPREDFYADQHPQAADVLLLIEVADSSLEYDQGFKLQLYARHNIPEYWVLNLNDQCLQVFRKPHGDNYEEKTTLRRGDSVSPSQLQNITLALSDIL